MSKLEALHEIMQNIKGIIFDIDGVFTDGKLHYAETGEAMKVFHVQDGLGIKLLLASPVQVGVISGCSSPILEARLQYLGITHFALGASDKTPPYQALLEKWSLEDKDIAYVGDDLPDLPLMAKVKLPITVANANPLVAAHAFWQTQRQGGEGAVREVCDAFLQANHCLEQCMEAIGHGKLP